MAKLPHWESSRIIPGIKPELMARRNFESLAGVLGHYRRQIEESAEDVASLKTATANYLEPALLGGGKVWDIRHFGTLAKALAVIGSTVATLYITKTVTVSSNTTIPSNISIVVLKGGSFAISTGVTLTIEGSLKAGEYQIFSGLGTVTFGNRQASISPFWWGAVGDNGTTDNADALLACFAAGGTQYNGPRIDLNGGRFGFSKRLKIQSPVYGRGAMLFPMGDGAQFKYANNPDTAGGVAVPDCAILIVDGGSIDGVAIVAKSDVDVIGNAGTWLVCVQAVYGKTPINNARINGHSTGKNLNGLAVRYCTVSNILGVGGSYFKNGFLGEASNWCNYSGVFFENMLYGGTPLKWLNSQGCTINGVWTEAWQGGSDLYVVQDCSGFRGHGFKIGEPLGSATQSGTADDTTDIIACASDPTVEDGMPLSFDTIVAPLVAGTIYFARDKSGNTFKVAATSGGAAIDLTAAGSVVFRKAAQSGLHVINCTDSKFTAYGNETNTAYQKRIGWVTGAGSSGIAMDSSFSAASDSYGKMVLEEIGYNRSRTVDNIWLADTSVKRFLGRLDYGTRVTFRITAKTSGLNTTDGGLNIYSYSGGTYTLRGTVTPASGALTTAGNVTALTYDNDTNGEFFIAPVAAIGDGVIEVLAEFKKYSGNTFV